jgi:flagellar hook-associated protein 3 FlgL
VALVGKDVNPQAARGILNILVRLQNALQNGDDATLTRLGGEIAAEADRLSGIRGVVGSRQQTLQNIDNSLQNQNLQTQQALSNAKDTDMATVLSELMAQQTAFEATLRIAAQTMQLSLANYL